MDINKLTPLIEKAKQNDEGAINALYEQIHGIVWFWARTSVKSDDDADEVTQRTMITVFRKLDTINDPNAFLGWLKTTTIRQAKDYTVAVKRRRSVNFSDAGLHDDEGHETDYDPAAEDLRYNPVSVLDKQRREDVLTGILDSLPDEQRIVVNMYWFDNMTSSAIADELGCSENTIKSRLKYAKAKIKSKVEEYQKKTGDKLYSVSPIAILLWLYKGAEKDEIMEIPWGAEAYPALEQTYHVLADSVPHNSGNGGNSGSNGADGSSKGSASGTNSASGSNGPASASADPSGVSNAGVSSASGTAHATVQNAAGMGANAAQTAAHTAGTGILASTIGKAALAIAITAGAGGAAVGITHVVRNGNDASTANTEHGNVGANLPADGMILNEDYLTSIGAVTQTIDIDDFGNLISYPDANYTYLQYEMSGFGGNWGYEFASDYSRQYAKTYQTPALRVMKDGKWGVMDYDGNLLGDYRASVIEYNGLLNTYCEYIDGAEYIMNGDYSLGEAVDGIGGEAVPIVVHDGVVVEIWDSNTLTPYSDTSGRRYLAEVYNGDNLSYWANLPDGYALVNADGSIVNLPTDGAPIAFAPYNLYSIDFSLSDEQNMINNNEYVMRAYGCFTDGVIIMVNPNGKFALYDANTMSYITGYDYDDVTYFNEDVCGVKQGDKWAFIDRSGKRLSDFVYDKVSAVSNGRVMIKDADGFKLVDISAVLKSAGYDVSEPTAQPNTSAPVESAEISASAETSAETVVSAPARTVTVLVEKLNIRTAPSVSADSVGHAEQGAVYEYTSVTQSDGYTWYQLADGTWIADKDGQYLSVSGN